MKKNPVIPIAGGELEEIFTAYFNNRMMVLLMLVEHPGISRDVLSVERQRFFLKDLYHHFLPSGCPSKYRKAFEWMFRFLDIYPDITPRRIYQAIQMIELIYEAFGLELPKRAEAVRLERESLQRRKKDA